MKYGLPYKGSKNGIAKRIIAYLPKGKRLVDLFGGGGAITHCALLSCKWQSILYNDINEQLGTLFRDAILGNLTKEKRPDLYRWISREEFFKVKGNDMAIAMCFSFGNGNRTYCYGKELEPYKKACHMAIVFDDWHDMEALCPEVTEKAKEALEGIENTKKRRLAFGPAIVKELKRLNNIELVKNNPLYSSCHVKHDTKTRKQDAIRDLQSLERLQSLQSLERLQSLQSLERLESNITFTVGSYEQYQYQEGDVVYCDIPYENTDNSYGVEFDHKAFYDWASSRPYEVYISSYQISDDRFTEVWNTEKDVLANQFGASAKCIERIYCNKVVENRNLMPAQLELFG